MSIGLAALVMVLKIVFDFIVKMKAKPAEQAHAATLSQIDTKLGELIGDVRVLTTKIEAHENHDERLRSLENKVAAILAV